MFRFPSLGLALLALSGVSCSSTAPVSATSLKAEAKRNQAPQFSLKDSDGKTVTLSEYKGKVVLLNFWATWCGPCKIEIPWFIDFEQKYRDRNFAVVGVSMDEEGWSAVKPYLAQNKLNYRILLGDEVTGQLYGGMDSLPTTFLIDRNGKIASTHVGLISKGDYETEIVQLLDSKTASAVSAVPSGGSLVARLVARAN